MLPFACSLLVLPPYSVLVVSATLYPVPPFDDFFVPFILRSVLTHNSCPSSFTSSAPEALATAASLLVQTAISPRKSSQIWTWWCGLRGLLSIRSAVLVHRFLDRPNLPRRSLDLTD